MNLGQIRAAVNAFANRNDLFAENPQEGELDITLLDLALNAAIREVSNGFTPLRITEARYQPALEQGEERYALPSDFHKVKSCMTLDSNEVVIDVLTEVDPSAFQRHTPDPDKYNLIVMATDDAPGIFTIEGEYIYVKPVPSDSTGFLLFLYNQFYPELESVEGAQNYFTNYWPMFCVFGTLYHLTLLLQVRGDNTVVDEVRSNYEKWQQEIINMDLYSRNETISPIPQSFRTTRFTV